MAPFGSPTPADTGAGLPDGLTGTDLVVHVGAGATAAPSGAVRRILVEADPEAAAALERATEGADTEVIAAALVPEAAPGARVALVRHNLSLFDGPLPDGAGAPTGARQLYPGLRERARTEVPALGVPALLERLPPAGPGEARDLLILDGLAGAGALLGAFEAAGGLARFGEIRVRAGRAPLWSGDAAAEEIAAWLAARGWNTMLVEEAAEPGLCRLVARPAAPTGAVLARMRDLEAAREAAEAARAAAETARSDAETRAADAQRRLREAESARDRARAAAETAEAESRAWAAELRRRGGAAGPEAAKGGRSRTEAEAEIVRLTEAMLADQRRAARMQAALQADLDDLRARHAALVEEKESRDRLLLQVTRRLGDAADYLRVLPAPEDEAPEGIAGPESGPAPGPESGPESGRGS